MGGSSPALGLRSGTVGIWASGAWLAEACAVLGRSGLGGDRTPGDPGELVGALTSDPNIFTFTESQIMRLLILYFRQL